MVSGTDLGGMLWSLHRIPIVLFTLLNIILKCDSNDKLSPRTMPKCLCEVATDTLLLTKTRWGSSSLFIFLLSITY